MPIPSPALRQGCRAHSTGLCAQSDSALDAEAKALLEAVDAVREHKSPLSQALVFLLFVWGSHSSQGMPSFLLCDLSFSLRPLSSPGAEQPHCGKVVNCC